MKSLSSLTPSTIIRLQVLATIVSVFLGVAVVLYGTQLIQSHINTADRDARYSIFLTEAQAGTGEILSILSQRGSQVLVSPQFLSLPEEQKQLISREVLRDPADVSPRPSDLPALTIPFSIPDALRIQAIIDRLTPTSSVLTSNSSAEQSAIVAQVFQGLAKFFSNQSLENYLALRDGLTQMRAGSQVALPAVVDRSAADLDELGRIASYSQAGVIIIAFVLGAVILAVSIIGGRRVQAVFVVSSREREELKLASETAAHRNSQLNALYNVFGEITDSLSVRYVVQATLREAKRLVDADLVTVRLLRGDQLEVVGSLLDDPEQSELSQPIQLGAGVMGRAAKRGKTIRIDENAGQQFREGESIPGVQSGFALPLIVGARVVGTLGCWSRRPHAFNDDDQRILEMMASQVATAIAAADLTETSEQRAQNDVLTGLPNRRQLNEDLSGPLALFVVNKRKAVVAMIDIDHFKTFNDDYGHRVGDVTLQKVASVLRSAIRENDLIYRYGGEEIVIVFPDLDGETAVLLAERIRQAVASTPITGESMEPIGPVTVSIGLAVLPDHGTNLEALIELADQAMYFSKDSGRNRVTLWRPGLREDLIATAAA